MKAAAEDCRAEGMSARVHLKNKGLDWICRLALGLVFIYAALPKIYDPQAFAAAIDNYRLFPAWSLAPLAVTLPWLELWTALMLLLGFWKRAAAFILTILLVSFMLAVGYNLARGLDFECGCFGSGSRRAGINLLWQDSLLLLCSIQVLFRRPRLKDRNPDQK